MGQNASSEQKQGYHVLKVVPGSPAARAGLIPFFDYIVAVNKTLLDEEANSLIKVISDNVNNKLSFYVYSSKTNTYRNVKFEYPIEKWTNAGEDGWLGFSVRYCSYDGAADHFWHVLAVVKDYPAFMAGIQPKTDYIIGSPNHVLKTQSDLYDLFDKYVNKPLHLYVYSTLTNKCREIFVVPTTKNGEGCIGCTFSYGDRISVKDILMNKEQQEKSQIDQQDQQNLISTSNSNNVMDQDSINAPSPQNEPIDFDFSNFADISIDEVKNTANKVQENKKIETETLDHKENDELKSTLDIESKNDIKITLNNNNYMNTMPSPYIQSLDSSIQTLFPKKTVSNNNNNNNDNNINRIPESPEEQINYDIDLNELSRISHDDANLSALDKLSEFEAAAKDNSFSLRPSSSKLNLPNHKNEEKKKSSPLQASLINENKEEDNKKESKLESNDNIDDYIKTPEQFLNELFIKEFNSTPSQNNIDMSFFSNNNENSEINITGNELNFEFNSNERNDEFDHILNSEPNLNNTIDLDTKNNKRQQTIELENTTVDPFFEKGSTMNIPSNNTDIPVNSKIPLDNIDNGIDNNVIQSISVIDDNNKSTISLDENEQNTLNSFPVSVEVQNVVDPFPINTANQDVVDPFPVNTEAQNVVDPFPVNTEGQSTIDPFPINTENQNVIDPFPVNTENQNVIDPFPVNTENQNVMDPFPVNIETQNVADPFSINTETQNVVDPFPINTANQDVVDPFPVNTENQNVVDSFPANTANQDVVDPFPINTETQNVVDPFPINSETQKVVDLFPVNTEDQSTIDPFPVNTANQNVVDLFPVNTEDQSIIDPFPVNTETQNVADSFPVNTANQNVVDPFSINSEAQNVIDPFPINSEVQKAVDPFPVNTENQNVVDPFPINTETQNVAGPFPINTENQNIVDSFPVNTANQDVVDPFPINTESQNVVDSFPVNTANQDVVDPFPINTENQNVVDSFQVNTANQDVVDPFPINTENQNVVNPFPVNSENQNVMDPFPINNNINNLNHFPINNELNNNAINQQILLDSKQQLNENITKNEENIKEKADESNETENKKTSNRISFIHDDLFKTSNNKNELNFFDQMSNNSWDFNESFTNNNSGWDFNPADMPTINNSIQGTPISSPSKNNKNNISSIDMIQQSSQSTPLKKEQNGWNFDMSNQSTPMSVNSSSSKNEQSGWNFNIPSINNSNASPSISNNLNQNEWNFNNINNQNEFSNSSPSQNNEQSGWNFNIPSVSTLNSTLPQKQESVATVNQNDWNFTEDVVPNKQMSPKPISPKINLPDSSFIQSNSEVESKEEKNTTFVGTQNKNNWDFGNSISFDTNDQNTQDFSNVISHSNPSNQNQNDRSASNSLFGSQKNQGEFNPIASSIQYSSNDFNQNGWNITTTTTNNEPEGWIFSDTTNQGGWDFTKEINNNTNNSQGGWNF